jgi:broad specificity phosphatase PhoE
MDELVLVRHGETTGESSVRYNGHTDVALSDLGARQMEAVGEALCHEAFDRVIVSPLRRSRRSGELVRGDRPGLETTTVEGLREIHFGAWEGLTVEEIAERDPDTYALWRRSPDDFQFPDGDSRYGFRARVGQASLDHVDPCEGKTLAVLHKGVIKVILVTLARLDPDAYHGLEVELGSVHRLRRHACGWELAHTGVVDHLGALRQPGS